MIKAVIYCRVSSREQEQTGYSLPAQEKLIDSYAKRKDFPITKKFLIAESASGKKQREVFGEMMNYIKKNNINILICEKVDRITRNFKEAVVVNDWLEENLDRQIHFVTQNLVIHKNARSDEKFRWDIEIVLAKKYIANLSEEVKKGQKEKIAQGGYPGRATLGYKTKGDQGHKIHVPDEKSAPFIKRMFEYAGSGNYSITSLVVKMYEEGLRSTNGGKVVKSRIEDMLKDPFYYGCIRWNGELHTNGAHEPLVSKELFQKVQDVLTRKKAPHYKSHNHVFKKMVKCGECGGNVSGEIQRGHVYYSCKHYHTCSQKGVTRQEEVENQLMGVFEFFETITPEEAEEIKNKIKADHAQEIEYKETTIKALTDRHSSLQRRLDRMYDDHLDEKITRDFWERKQKEITDEQSSLLERIAKVKSEEAKYFEIWLNIIDLARRASEIYAKRTPEEKRLLLTHIFSNLTLKDKKVSHSLKKPFEVLAKRVQERIDQQKIFEQQKTLTTQGRKGDLQPDTNALLPRQGSNLRPID